MVAGAATTAPCRKLACEIQACLAQHGYREDRCRDVIRLWKACMARADQHHHQQHQQQQQQQSPSSPSPPRTQS
ncbi:unnamed protein product (mitochondrion) [Plasmodiophora brassicae]|uniref:CHCH domain-containing protein n=1 Tax=Plasmodiophora brassicae TaxID=37360 RepID=A0A0G4IP32_PLABS|nr:hypothetical protein PBRA_005615 [Plasmodiophora brassicae]SPR00991.1 unnamed protein product [Plasmodiophora brassicae]